MVFVACLLIATVLFVAVFFRRTPKHTSNEHDGTDRHPEETSLRKIMDGTVWIIP